MKIKTLPALLMFAASPIALIASSATDNKIEEAANASYNYRAVLEDHVKVSAKDGVVTLTGKVQDEEDRELAADTAKNLPGAIGVDNQVEIEPTYMVHSDAWMAYKIRNRILVKGGIRGASIQVVVNDGNVVLTGTVDNLAQKELTRIYAKGIDGVKTVENDIVVTNIPAMGGTTGNEIATIIQLPVR